MDLAVNNLSLFFSAMLVVVALIISTKEKLGFTKDIIISVIRAVIKLVAVGAIPVFTLCWMIGKEASLIVAPNASFSITACRWF